MIAIQAISAGIGRVTGDGLMDGMRKYYPHQLVYALMAAILVANPNVKLRISGHADERGSDEYNLALANRRAAAAKRYLESKGVDGGRMEVVSYGEERPLNPGSDEDAYAQNRRDEFEVTAGGDNLVAPQ